jgi:hypothetical protein
VDKGGSFLSVHFAHYWSRSLDPLKHLLPRDLARLSHAFL